MLDKILKYSLYGLTAIIVAAFLHYVGWLRPLENFLIKGLSPFQSSINRISEFSWNFYEKWLKKRDLLKENEELKNKLIQAVIDESRFKALQEENELLKKELNFVEERHLKFVSAKIIAGVSDPFTRSVIINRGARDGLEKGLAVVANEGILVGKISEVYDNFSKVILLNDSSSKVAATVQNLDHTIGIVEGQYGLSFSMTNIPQNQNIKEGDKVVTSGLEGKIPKNLLIAEVESVKSVESEIFKTAILKPIISLDNLSYVEIIIP